MTFEVQCPSCKETVQIPFPEHDTSPGQTDQSCSETPQSAPVGLLHKTANACAHLAATVVFGDATGVVVGATLFCLTIPVKLSVSSGFATQHGFNGYTGDLDKSNEFFTQLFIKCLATSATLGITVLGLWTWKRLS